MLICGYKTVKKKPFNSFNSKLNLGKTLAIELGRKCDARDRRFRNSSLTCALTIRQLKINMHELINSHWITSNDIMSN